MGNQQSTLADKPDMHGFVVSGIHSLFLDHLPMFGMTEHRYQQVLHVDIPDWALSFYREAAKNNPGSPFILGNIQEDLFTLPSIKTHLRTGFIGDLFEGIPENPQTQKPFIHGLPVCIRDVVYHRPFDDLEAVSSHLTYIIYGSGSEAFISHYMVRKPDFQHIARLSAVPSWLPIPVLEAGARISLCDFSSDDCSEPPFEDGAELSVQFQNSPTPLKLLIGTTTYFDNTGVNM